MLIYLLILLSFFCGLYANNVQDLAILSNNLNQLARVKKPKKKFDIKLIEQTNDYIKYQLGKYKINLKIVSIFMEPADAMVNAANKGCVGGGGIDGFISDEGGDKSTKPGQHKTLYDYRFELKDVNGVKCPEGDARITKSGWMAYPPSYEEIDGKKIGYFTPGRKIFKYVIQAVGPTCKKDQPVSRDKKKILIDTYLNVLNRVIEHNKASTSEDKIKVINVPAISAGIYHCAPEYVANPVVKKLLKYLTDKPNLEIDQINFVFIPSDRDANYIPYADAFKDRAKS